MKNFLLLLPLFAFLISGCDRNENLPKAASSVGSSSPALTSNAISLVPANWSFSVGDVGNQDNPNNYQPAMTTGTSGTSSTSPLSTTGLGGMSSRTTSYTIGISTSVLNDTASYCYWHYGFYPPTTLHVGKSLTLKAKVRLNQVQGKGVSLVLRGDQGSKAAVLFATTQGKLNITGSADLTEYSVTLPYSRAVDLLAVYFVMLPNTSGSVTFSDVSVQVN